MNEKVLEPLLHRQKVVDDAAWQVGSANDQLRKGRHICLHLAKTLGRLAGVFEEAEHKGDGVDGMTHRETITNAAADLLIHSLQLSNLFAINLDSAFAERLERNIAKYGRHASSG